MRCPRLSQIAYGDGCHSYSSFCISWMSLNLILISRTTSSAWCSLIKIQGAPSFVFCVVAESASRGFPILLRIVGVQSSNWIPGNQIHIGISMNKPLSRHMPISYFFSSRGLSKMKFKGSSKIRFISSADLNLSKNTLDYFETTGGATCLHSAWMNRSMASSVTFVPTTKATKVCCHCPSPSSISSSDNMISSASNPVLSKVSVKAVGLLLASIALHFGTVPFLFCHPTWPP